MSLGRRIRQFFHGGDLEGSAPNPTVRQARGLRETAGPTTLTMGAVADGEFLKRSGTSIVSAAAGGSGLGDVVGPAGATDNALVRYDTTTGKLIQNSTVTLDDTGAFTVPEMAAPGTPAAGKVAIYAKTDGHVYIKDDAGTETDLASVAAALTADAVSAPVYAADAGASDAYAITLSPVPSGYTTGTHYRFKANTANTGACTLDVNSLGAKTIKKAAGGITTDLADNDIRAGQFVDVVYDGTNMQMQSTLGNAGGVSFPLLASDGTQGAPSYAFTNGTDCGLYFVNGTPDHLKIGVGNKEFLDMYQGGGKPVVLMTTNLDTKIGFGNGSLRSGVMDGGKGSVKFISDESGTSGCGFSATADLVDVVGTRRPFHIAGQVFRHVLTGNRTIGPVSADGGSNSISGILITIILVQDATGGRTVTWDSSYKWAGGSAPTMTSAANAVDIYRFWCDENNQAFELGRTMDVK